MNDNLQPLSDDQLEARITAYVLGEASPFEAAEIRSLIEKSPELRLFHDRLRTLDTLVKDAETTSNSADEKWKLPAAKRSALEPMLGSSNQGGNIREFRIRRAAFRSAIGIAAVFVVTLFLSKFFRFTNAVKESAMVETYSAKSESKVPQTTAFQLEERGEEHEKILSAISRTKLSKNSADEKVKRIDGLNLRLADGQANALPAPDLATAEPSVDFGDKEGFGSDRSDSAIVMEETTGEPAVHIGGQVRKPGPQEFKEGLTLWDAVQSAGGATEFGSNKRVKIHRNGETGTYDLTDKRSFQVEIQPGDTIEMPQKQWFGCGGGREEITKALAENAEKATPVPTVEADPIEVEAVPMADEAPASRNSENADARYGGDKSEIETRFRGKQQAGDSIPAPTAEPAAEMSSLAQREMIRRQQAVADADEKLTNGRDAYSKGNYSGAVDDYKKALEELPDSPTTEQRRDSYTDHLKDASIAQAQQLRKIGKYDEAREMLEQAESSAPGDAQIKQELADLDDPIRTNSALTDQHSKDVDEVRRSLYMAQGNYDLGKFDKAKELYEETLRFDPYNKAARRGMEKIEAAKSDYYRAAYDQTRSELLMKADKDWELEVPAEKEAELKKRKNVSGPSVDGGQPEQKMDPIRAELLKEVDRAWDLAAPSDKEAESKKGKEKEESGFSIDADQPEQDERSVDAFADALPSDKQNSKQVSPKQIEFTTKAVEQPGFDFDGLVDYGASIEETPTDTAGGFQFENSRYFFRSDSRNTEIPGSTFGIDGLENNLKFGRDSNSPTGFDTTEFWNLRGLSMGGEGQQDLGLLSESAIDDSTSLADQVPILGDLPVTGKLSEQPKIDLADLTQEIPASQEPFSTFSLNVSDASFQIAAAAIENGESPDPESIKPEQFYNGVDYGDPAPSSTEPVAAAIDQTAHPVIPGRNLVRVGIRTASTGRSAAQPLRLTLMVDQSGSMVRDDRRAAMKTALDQLATLLNENDEVTVIGFSRTPRLLADSLKGDKAGNLPDLINQAANEGGTNIEEAMNLASDLALRHKLEGAQNRIVLFTDGAANLGNANPDILAEKIKELRQQDLSFDIAGIGTNDLNDELLSELARHGNGRYYLVGEDTGASLATQLAGAFRPAAENVKVQVKLNPERVGSYKLIGFEKDRLKTEDFRNDSVDAAELAADEAGVAMYQIETLPEGSGEIGEVSVRFRDTASGEMVERTWTIPYDPTAPAFDKAPPKTQLATLSLLAAQKLQGGPLADAINFKNFAKTIAELRDAYESDLKAQRMLNLVNALK